MIKLFEDHKHKETIKNLIDFIIKVKENDDVIYPEDVIFWKNYRDRSVYIQDNKNYKGMIHFELRFYTDKLYFGEYDEKYKILSKYIYNKLLPFSSYDHPGSGEILTQINFNVPMDDINVSFDAEEYNIMKDSGRFGLW